MLHYSTFHCFYVGNWMSKAMHIMWMVDSTTLWKVFWFCTIIMQSDWLWAIIESSKLHDLLDLLHSKVINCTRMWFSALAHNEKFIESKTYTRKYKGWKNFNLALKTVEIFGCKITNMVSATYHNNLDSEMSSVFLVPHFFVLYDVW